MVHVTQMPLNDVYCYEICGFLKNTVILEVLLIMEKKISVK